MTRIAIWLWPLALAVAAAPASADEAKPAVQFIPSGVTDTAGKKGFVANASGGVDALDLESGKCLWTYKDGGKPLAVVGDRLLVQAKDKDKGNVLRVVFIDIADGTKAKESDPIDLPAWAVIEEGRGAGHSFHSSARLDGDLLIAWQAGTFYWGGAAPTPEILKAATKNASGVARVNVESGKVEMLDADKAPPPPAVKVSKELEKAAARPYGFGDAAQMKVATVGNLAVAVDVEPAADKKQKVVLKQWDLATEKALDPVVLAEGAAYQAVAVPSAGVALVRRLGLPEKAPEEDAAWTVYSLETGKKTGMFLSEPNTAEITVVGPRAYYVVKEPSKTPFGGVLPRTLKAVDLKSAKRLWERPLEGERLPPPPPP
jgi:hypothetical protein